MPAVFVHGNPETPVIWEPLLAELSRTDVHTPQLPGFGCPSPPGWDASKESYVAWFIAELERIVADGGPVDLVGHDWGGIISMRTVSQRPDLIRSWTCDVLGTLHADYVWHDFAQIWQTPGAGEEFFASTMATPAADRVAMYESMGIPAAIGTRLVAAGDDEMNRCVLALYRSATQPALAQWGTELDPARTRPGLAVIAPLDPFVRAEDLGAETADRLGARKVVLDGQGHWWMLGDPARGARMLEEFWSSI